MGSFLYSMKAVIWSFFGLRRKGDSIALEPANQAHKTRIFGPDRVKLQGKLIGLMRKY